MIMIIINKNMHTYLYLCMIGYLSSFFIIIIIYVINYIELFLNNKNYLESLLELTLTFVGTRNNINDNKHFKIIYF